MKKKKVFKTNIKNLNIIEKKTVDEEKKKQKQKGDRKEWGMGYDIIKIKQNKEYMRY